MKRIYAELVLPDVCLALLTEEAEASQQDLDVILSKILTTHIRLTYRIQPAKDILIDD